MPLFDERQTLFVQSTLRSVWALELMLLMRGNPDRTWSADALTRQLRASLPLVTEILGDLRRSGLVAAVGNDEWTWRPSAPEIEGCAQAVADAYARTPFQVIKMIVELPNERLRTFADAFKLRKPPEEGPD